MLVGRRRYAAWGHISPSLFGPVRPVRLFASVRFCSLLFACLFTLTLNYRLAGHQKICLCTDCSKLFARLSFSSVAVWRNGTTRIIVEKSGLVIKACRAAYRCGVSIGTAVEA